MIEYFISSSIKYSYEDEKYLKNGAELLDEYSGSVVKTQI